MDDRDNTSRIPRSDPASPYYRRRVEDDREPEDFETDDEPVKCQARKGCEAEAVGDDEGTPTCAACYQSRKAFWEK